MMTLNVGGIDKILRMTVGALLVVLAVMGVIPVWGWVGVVLLATGVINFCPIYPLLGISTRKKA